MQIKSVFFEAHNYVISYPAISQNLAISWCGRSFHEMATSNLNFDDGAPGARGITDCKFNRNLTAMVWWELSLLSSLANALPSSHWNLSCLCRGTLSSLKPNLSYPRQYNEMPDSTIWPRYNKTMTMKQNTTWVKTKPHIFEVTGTNR